MRKWFDDCSLTKKANILLFLFVIIPFFLFGIILMMWVYRTNISELHTENDHGLEIGIKKLEQCYSEVEALPILCMQNEPLQRIGANRTVGKDYVKVREWLDEIYESAPWYQNISISLNNGKRFQAGSYVEEDVESVLRQLGNEKSVWITGEVPVYSLRFDQMNEEKILTFYAAIDSYYYGENKKPIGSISIRLKEQEFSKLYEEELKKGYRSVCLLDKNGRIISSSDQEALRKGDMEPPAVFTKMQGRTQGMFWYGKYIMFFHQSQMTGGYLVEEIPLFVFYGNLLLMMSLLFCAVLLCILFCVIFNKIQKKYVIQPVFGLVDAFGDMERAEFVTIPDVHRKDEIGILQEAFNQMTERLDNLINQVYRIDYEKQEAQLRALTEQINPHFLYNTLDSIHWKAIRNKDLEVAEQILALSDVYRYLLNQGKEKITIRDEVKFQEKYLYLMSMRYGNRVAWKSEVSEDALDLMIPKLIIQPLIENAIVHGIEPSPEGGSVILRIYREKGELVIDVKDTGVGFGRNLSLRNDELHALEGAFALKNMNSRLKLHYPKGYECWVKSSKNGGSHIIIRICLEEQI